MRIKFSIVVTMRTSLIVAVLLVVFGYSAMASQAVHTFRPDSTNILKRVKTLTCSELAGRGSGTPEADATADTLSAWFADLGLTPAFTQSWYQQFPLQGVDWGGLSLAGKYSRNVAGIIPGRGQLSDRFIVIGAHYDHLGRVLFSGEKIDPPSKQKIDSNYYPGANDNASGISVLCELARLAVGASETDSGKKTSYRSVVVVAFGAEEVGLQGSSYFVANLPVPQEKIDAMINFDTVGQLVDNTLYVSGVGTTSLFPEQIKQANTEGLRLILGQSGWSGSDHMSFNAREIPVLFVFSGPYPQYNRPSDDWATINVDGLLQITSFANRLLCNLRLSTANYSWLKVESAALQISDSSSLNKDTWFGSIPDFSRQEPGYHLAGVIDNSPAAKAGLQKGDMVTKLAGTEVVDLPSFTRALRSHDPGSVVELAVIRAGKLLNFTIVLGNRQDRN